MPSSVETRDRVVLHVEDSDEFAALTAALLDGAGYAVERTSTLADAQRAIRSGGHCCAFVDLDLPDAAGLQAVIGLRGASEDLPLVVLSGTDSASAPVRAVLLGAQEWLAKQDVSPERLARAASMAIARQDAQAQLLWRASHDVLTGLPNRARASEHLTWALARAARKDSHVGVLFCDLDHFKQVNDKHGHPAGDDVLRVVAERILAVVRPGDLVARWGGDEIVVIAEPINSERELVGIAERLRAAVAQPLDLHGVIHVPTATVGSVVGAAGDEANRLIEEADSAMLAAKRSGTRSG